jgi:hypothetical protein
MGRHVRLSLLKGHLQVGISQREKHQISEAQK